MLEQVPIFASLPEEHLRRLEAISRQIFVEKGPILFSPGDATQGFYAALEGAVRVYRVSPKGKEISLEIVGAGSIAAGASLFSDIYHCYAEALKESTVCPRMDSRSFTGGHAPSSAPGRAYLEIAQGAHRKLHPFAQRDAKRRYRDTSRTSEIHCHPSRHDP